MTSKQNGFPWVNVWMLVFSIGGIWLIGQRMAITEYGGSGNSLIDWFPLLILVAIGIVALRRIPLPFPEEETERPATVISEMGVLYLSSLRMISRQKWMLILIGIVALVTVLDLAIQSRIFNRPELKQTIRQSSMMRDIGEPMTLLDYIKFPMSTDLAQQVEKSPGEFYPGVNVRTKGIVPPVAVVLFILWLNGRLSSLSRVERYRRSIYVLRFMFIPVAVLGLAEPVTTYISWTNTVNMLIHNSRGHFPPSITTPMAVQIWTWSLASGLLISPLIMAGFCGSLKRSMDDEQVTDNTFAEDAVRYLKPFVGVALVFTIVSLPLMVPGWSSLLKGTPSTLPPWFTLFNSVTGFVTHLAYMLLMFLPFVVVAQDSGSLRAFGIGVKDWVRNVGITVPFVALGITLVVPVTLIERALTQMVGDQSLWAQGLGTIFRIADVLVAVWLSVAVWELYWRIGNKPVLAEIPAEVV